MVHHQKYFCETNANWCVHDEYRSIKAAEKDLASTLYLVKRRIATQMQNNFLKNRAWSCNDPTGVEEEILNKWEFWILEKWMVGKVVGVARTYVPSKNYAKLILSVQDLKNLSSKFQDIFYWSETLWNFGAKFDGPDGNENMKKYWIIKPEHNSLHFEGAQHSKQNINRP